MSSLQERTLIARAVAALVCAALGLSLCAGVQACAPGSGPESSGESHLGNLLLECASDTACDAAGNPAADLTCACSFCTLPCENVDACTAALGDLIPSERLRCRLPMCLTAEDDGMSPASAGICDVACQGDEDCAEYGDGFSCVGGYCRNTSTSPEPGNAGTSCALGTIWVRGSPDGSVADACLEEHEVTVVDYTSCVDAGACSAPEQGNYYVADRDEHPVDFVSRSDAEAYCAFRGRALPTRLEWQWAAQNGRVNTTYPWGDTVPSAADDPPLVCALGTTESCVAETFLGGSTSEGIADLAGNVAELVLDGASVCAAGGSFLSEDPAELAGTSCAAFAAPAAAIGFRCLARPN